jgi:hypothetical protein
MKSYLGIASGNTSYDSFLTEQLVLLTDVITAYCRRNFESATYVQTFYKDENCEAKSISVFQYPLISVTSVVEDGQTLSTDFYRLNKPSGTIVGQDKVFFRAKQTDVTYVAGFATVPSPVQSVVKSIVQERYNKKSSGISLDFGSDVQRISIPGAISIDFDYTLSNNERSSAFGSILGNHANVLDFYRSERAIIGSDKLTYIG